MSTILRSALEPSWPRHIARLNLWLQTMVQKIKPAKLLFDGAIKTPKPIAVIREKKGLFAGLEYLVTEKAQGQILSDLSATDLIQDGLDKKLNRLFINLLAAQLSHGDMKATNLFVDGEVVLIDLDSM